MQKSFGREVASVLLRATVVVLTIVVVIWSIGALYEAETGISDGFCNIAVIPVEGAILPFHGIGDFDLVITPETIDSLVSAAENEKGIDAILLEVNSPGGTPVASERIAERFRSSNVPVVGLIGDIGASGGYMVASAADHLIASPMSDVGSIGVTMSYLEESEKNKEEGITYVQLTTGKFKDAGSANRPITEEERERFMEDLNIIHSQFVNIVSKYRNLPREEVVALADGSTMPGIKAYEVGLIDELGGHREAKETLAKILGLEVHEVIFCDAQSSLLPF